MWKKMKIVTHTWAARGEGWGCRALESYTKRCIVGKLNVKQKKNMHSKQTLQTTDVTSHGLPPQSARLFG